MVLILLLLTDSSLNLSTLTKVVTFKESPFLTPFTESDKKHEVDETDLNILSLFLENPVPINSDFSYLLHNKQDLLTMQRNDPSLEKLFSLVRSKSEDASFFILS